MEAPSVALGRGEGSGWLDLDWPVPRARSLRPLRGPLPCAAGSSFKITVPVVKNSQDTLENIVLIIAFVLGVFPE